MRKIFDDLTVDGDITADNFSGTNTGDQDLSGYLLNTTDTLTGNLTVTGTIGSGAITSTGKITGTELEGTSLDINGAANIDGLLDVNTGTANQVAIFESTDDKAFIRIKDDDTNAYLIAKDNKFSIGESSSDYDNFKIDLTTGNATFAGDVTADSFIKDGGTSTQFLMADGSVSTGGSSGVTSIAASTVDGKEGIEVTDGSSAAVTVGLDLDLIDQNDQTLTHVIGVDDDDKNVKTEKSQFFAYNEQYIGYITGDGTATSFTITHDLGTRYLIQIVDTKSTSNTYLQEVYPKVVRNTNGTTVDITFKTAPANGHTYEAYMMKINVRSI